jgi:hypothetical protein
LGEKNSEQYYGKLPLVYTEIGMDKQKLWLEPVKAKRMEVAEEQKPCGFEEQSE